MVATQHCYFADMAYENKCVRICVPISKVAMLGCYRDVVNLCACGCLFHFAPNGRSLAQWNPKFYKNNVRAHTSHISKIAMLLCVITVMQHVLRFFLVDNIMVATQHCYFADGGAQFKHIWFHKPYQQNSNAAVCDHCHATCSAIFLS
jgi:hypothetical protein